MSTSEVANFDAEILARVVNPDQGDLSRELASAVLKFSFSSEDQERMRMLAEKARLGELTESEQAELDGFVRVGQFVGMMKSKARASLRRTSS